MQSVPRNSAENPHFRRWHAACCGAEVKGTGMRHITRIFTATLVVVAFAVDAHAQDKRVNGIISGGYTFTGGEAGERLGDGYNINFGAQVNVTPIISIEALYSFHGIGEEQISIPVSGTPGGGTVPTDFFVSMNMQSGTGAVVFTKPEGTVRPFGLVGMGIYYRPVEVSTPGVGFVPGYCDPWWYVCYPGGFVPVENVVGERSSTDFGMVFGGGANFGPAFAELRYHYIWGPKVESQTIGQTVTDERNANGQFLAITFGVKF